MKRNITKLFAVCLMLAAGAAQAATIEWKGNQDNDWNVATNWSGNYVPGTLNAVDTARIQSGTPVVSSVVDTTNLVDILLRNTTLVIGADMNDIRRCRVDTGGASISHIGGSMVVQEANSGWFFVKPDASYTISGGALGSRCSLVIQSDGLFNVVGTDASVSIGDGAGDNLVIQDDAILKFTLGATGVSTIGVADQFIVNSNSMLVVDASDYTGDAAMIDLVTFGTNTMQFAMNNITVSGVKSWSVGYETNKMFLDLVPYGPGDTLVIGKDDNDGDTLYLSRVSSGTRQDTAVTWAICNRSNVANPDFVDASLFLADGTPTTNTTDVLGFLESTKTDNIFGMYRGGLAPQGELVYTFDINQYTNLNMEVDFAATGDLFDKNIQIAYSIDGGTTNTILDIGQLNANWIQTMEDGRSVTNTRTGTVTVNGVGAANLSDDFQTYAPTMAGTGSELTVIVSMGSSVGGNYAFGMDNLKLFGTLMEPVTPSMDFDSWAASYGLTGDDALPGADVEPDGLDNLMEYGLGGNPTNDDHAAVAPATFTADDGGTNWFYHIYDQRVNDAALTFTVGATDDLAGTPADTNDVEFVGQSDEVDGFRTQTNRTEMTTDAKFIRLQVED
ncbi:hypothetical protein P4B35_07590 [Pontiellaceae bacterium B12227]|nr:hypothetical protein [Pontiellaceae bacterium B12227]